MKGQILIYNNVSEVADLMRPLFEGEDYEPKVVESLEDIKETLKVAEVLMLITDVELSGVNGFAVIEEVIRYV